MRIRFGRNSIARWIGLGSIVVLGGCSASSDVLIDCYSTTQYKALTLPTFHVYVLNVDTKDGSRIDVYVEIPYPHLRFQKELGAFKASYGFSLVVRGEGDTIAYSREFERTVSARSYEETVSRSFDAFLQTIPLHPGTYSLDAILTDNSTRLEYRLRRAIAPRDFHKASFSASDMLFIENAISEGKSISLLPVFPTNFSRLKDSLGFFQELYRVCRGDSIRLVTTYLTARLNVSRNRSSLFHTPPYSVDAPQCMKDPDSVYFRHDSTMTSTEDGTKQVIELFPKPVEGFTLISRKVFLTRNGAADSVTSTLKVLVPSPFYPEIMDAQEMIEILRYIARDDEIDSMLAGSPTTPRDERIAAFWDHHGGTSRRMEFQQRAKEANELFTSCIEGAKTPMGITYLICGLPEYIECQGMYGETWYYTVGNRTLVIPFRLRSQDPDMPYYEIIPFSVNEFLWQYFVDRWRRR